MNYLSFILPRAFVRFGHDGHPIHFGMDTAKDRINKDSSAESALLPRAAKKNRVLSDSAYKAEESEVSQDMSGVLGLR